jgi:RNA polymerase sigma factor (sigma-70 family)
MTVKKQFSDSDYIDGLKINNDKILSSLYKKFYPIVLKYVLNNNGSEQEAQDIYQETILVLYKNCKKSEFELKCALQTYIYSIAKRLWLKQINANKNLYRLNNENDNDNNIVDVANEINEHLEKENQLQKMKLSLTGLGEPCKTLLEDFYISQLNMEEIAEKFGYTNSDNAKNQKYKCLQRLKKLYFND